MKNYINKKLIIEKIHPLLLMLLVLIISVKADGRFPFPNSLSILKFQLLLFIFFSVPFLIIFKTYIFNSFILNKIPEKFMTILEKLSIYRMIIFTGILFELLTLIILVLSNRKYTNFGYSLNIPLTMAIFGIIIFGFLLFLKFEIKIKYLMSYVIGAFIFINFLSIFYFPLHPDRSDMLLLIVSACKKFLNGANPYTFHFIPHKLPLTYLPGLWLSFLPSAILNFDPRIINLLFTVSSMLILIVEIKNKDHIFLLITIFLLNPYLQYRHEIYIGVYLFFLSLAYIMLIKNRNLLASALFGWTMAISQFSWIIFPFLLIYFYKNFELKKVILYASFLFLIFILTVSPFVIWSKNGFYTGLFKHWDHLYNMEIFRGTMKTINLSYFLSFVISPKYFRIFQFLTLILIFIFSFTKIKSLGSSIKWMALALLVFILFNQLIWVYFFLVVFILLIYYNISISLEENLIK